MDSYFFDQVCSSYDEYYSGSGEYRSGSGCRSSSEYKYLNTEEWCRKQGFTIELKGVVKAQSEKAICLELENKKLQWFPKRAFSNHLFKDESRLLEKKVVFSIYKNIYESIMKDEE